MEIKNLIGIPFSQMNCVELVFKAYEIMTGKKYDWKNDFEITGNWKKDSLQIPYGMMKYFDMTNDVKSGTILEFVFNDTYHLGIMIDNFHFLHVIENDKSKISKYKGIYKKYTIGMWR